jgi:hypothetical protein
MYIVPNKPKQKNMTNKEIADLQQKLQIEFITRCIGILFVYLITLLLIVLFNRNVYYLISVPLVVTLIVANFVIRLKDKLVNKQLNKAINGEMSYEDALGKLELLPKK